MTKFLPPGLGWTQSLRDFRDFTPDTAEVHQMLGQLPARGNGAAHPDVVDLREYFPPVQNQLGLNSSTSHAAVSLVEYFVRRANGRIVEPSRLFLYHTTRKLMRATGHVGLDLRSTFKAMRHFGIPPEQYWPYEVERADCEPGAFLYSFFDDYRPIRYVRLDMRNRSGLQTLDVVRSFLAAGLPVVFGFPVPNSITTSGEIPYRPAFDSIRGGQAVLGVGYDDRHMGATRGALLVRNSWGQDWGENGYGWLPYRYVEEQLATEFWTLLHPEWLHSGEFSRPIL